MPVGRWRRPAQAGELFAVARRLVDELGIPESVACAPYADARRRHGRSAVALVAGLCVRPVSARATLHARARTKMAREARARRWVVEQGALCDPPNTPLSKMRRETLAAE